MTKQKCPHDEPPDLGYVSSLDDATRRRRKGERQKQCPVCKRWIWYSFYYVVKAMQRKSETL